jgi:hypothetical protein
VIQRDDKENQKSVHKKEKERAHVSNMSYRIKYLNQIEHLF